MENSHQNPEKYYLSIGEVAKKFGIKTSTLRFWEQEFDFIKPYKNQKGTRFYEKKDIKTIALVYHLLKERGYTIEGAKQRLQVDKMNLDKQQQVYDTLLEIRTFLLNLKAELDRK